MSLGRYVITASTTVSAGTSAAAVAGEPATGGQAGYGSAATTGGQLFPVTYPAGQAIMLDPAGPLYAAIGAGNLRAWADGQDNARPGISN